MIRPPPRTTRTDTTLSLHDALPIYNDDNYFKQPGDLFRLMTPEQQQALFDNTARAMGDAPDFIKRRHVDNCTKADPAYGAGVEAALRTLGAFAGTTSPNSLGEEQSPTTAEAVTSPHRTNAGSPPAGLSRCK